MLLSFLLIWSSLVFDCWITRNVLNGEFVVLFSTPKVETGLVFTFFP